MAYSPLRIFVSSPGDVIPERLIAKRVIDRLAREFDHSCKIEPILWERLPLVATDHFQANIIPPSECDIVVVIVWSRLGSPLPLEDFPGPISGLKVTGTEWEFEDAIKSYQVNKKPDLLVYRKQAQFMVSLEDDVELDRQRKQKKMLTRFLKHWFIDQESDSFKAASHTFEDSVAFENMLETHTRELIVARIGQNNSSKLSISWHKGSPFRGLQTFEVEHAPIFFGRTQARNELREMLMRQNARGSGFVLVFGASGSGKSSLVKAGLLPDLMLPGMVDNVGLIRVAIMSPSDKPRDLLGGLSYSLLGNKDTADVIALPELIDQGYDEDILSEQLRNPSTAELPIHQGLQAARATASLAEYALARVVIVVDQIEELFTHEFDNDDRDAFIATLSALARCNLVWVIATMRSDFFDHLAVIPELALLAKGEGRYLLMPPIDAELGQIITQPAREAGLQFENRSDGISLDEFLREHASRDPAALPLLEFTLDQLWHQRDIETGMLTFTSYEKLGGMEGALAGHAEQIFTAQSEPVQSALPSVLRALVTVGQGEQVKPLARTVPLTTFPAGTAQRDLVEAFLAPEARLLTASSDGSGAQIRIAHEALLSRWPRAASHIANNIKDVQTRTNVELAMHRWQQACENDRPSLLLAQGLPLSEAEELVSRRHPELDAELLEYVEISSKAVREVVRTLELVNRQRMGGERRVRRSFFDKVVSFLLGPSVPKDIPVRVQNTIKSEHESNEVLISVIQLLVVSFMTALYLVSPNTAPTQSEFDPVPLVILAYMLFTIVRLLLAYRRLLQTWMLYLSIVVDMALLFALIWSFHIMYMQPPSFYLKVPTIFYVYIFIALRGLGFQARYVLTTGIAATLGWMLLVWYAVQPEFGQSVITQDYILSLTSSRVFIGMEIEKILSITLVTVIFSIASTRARRVLIRASLESDAASELTRILKPNSETNNRSIRKKSMQPIE